MKKRVQWINATGDVNVDCHIMRGIFSHALLSESYLQFYLSVPDSPWLIGNVFPRRFVWWYFAATFTQPACSSFLLLLYCCCSAKPDAAMQSHNCCNANPTPLQCKVNTAAVQSQQSQQVRSTKALEEKESEIV